jgi:hypothetical protein
MQKKFLRIFTILVAFSGVLGLIGIKNACGMTAAEFEEEIQRVDLSHFVCSPWKTTRKVADTIHSHPARYEEVGKSIGPQDVVTHMRPVQGAYNTWTKNPDIVHIKCRNCNHELSTMDKRQPPKVTFKWTSQGGLNMKMMVLTWPNKNKSASVCAKAMIPGSLETLWFKAGLDEKPETSFANFLNRLWDAAKEEDSKNPTYTDALTDYGDETMSLTTPPSKTSFETGYNIEHEYGSCCCLIL